MPAAYVADSSAAGEELFVVPADTKLNVGCS